MTNKKPEKPLSDQDKALWEKVQKSVDQPNRAKAGNANPKRKSSKPEQQPEALNPTKEDFAALLQEGVPRSGLSANRPRAQNSAPQKALKKTNPKPTAPLTTAKFSAKEARHLSTGKQQIEGMIDLHGHTQQAAETALKTFLKRAQADGKKFVLVITGKGQKNLRDQPFELGAPEPGVLKRRVPNWLEDMPEVVISYKTAHKSHGGEGALYVRLRRVQLPTG